MNLSRLAARRAALVLAAVSSAPAALAGDTGTAELNEILVTAEKTSAPLSTIPISISAVSGETLNQDKIIQRPNIAAVEYGMTVRPRTVGGDRKLCLLSVIPNWTATRYVVFPACCNAVNDPHGSFHGNAT